MLPKSSQPARLQENLAALDFVLDAEHMAALDGLEEGLVTGWDPGRCRSAALDGSAFADREAAIGSAQLADDDGIDADADFEDEVKERQRLRL